ncbi:hypothetical protein K32_37370 [Kaistia sp. 32K]|nr:hypothetical protein K32_37370 [Kaistia sp. 32K]
MRLVLRSAVSARLDLCGGWMDPCFRRDDGGGWSAGVVFPLPSKARNAPAWGSGLSPQKQKKPGIADAGLLY